MKDQSIHDEYRWLGTVISEETIDCHMIVGVLHNKIQNRTNDEMGYHIYFPLDGKSHFEHYPSFELALIALALIRQGKDTNAVKYMARVGML